jgi:transcription initiation factor TFIID subunit 9B
MDQAEKRNRVALPRIDRSFGMQLPPEKYCLTGVGWGLKEEWDSEEEVLDEDVNAGAKQDTAPEKDDERMGGVDGDEDEDEEGAGKMEDVFGAEGGGGDDTAMTQD